MSTSFTNSSSPASDGGQLFTLPALRAQAFLMTYWRMEQFEVIGRYDPHPTLPAMGFIKELHHPAGGRPLRSPVEKKWLPCVFVQGKRDADQQLLEPGQWYSVEVDVVEPAQRRGKETNLLVAKLNTLHKAEPPLPLLANRETPTRLGIKPSQRATPTFRPTDELSLLQKRSAQVAQPREWSERRGEIQEVLEERSNLGKWGTGFASRLLGQVTARLATASDRMFWELLQNADDKPTTSKHPPTATFHLLPNYLLFLHNGQPFSRADVEGIADAADGTKPEEENMTGYKGIGFKSVFATSRAVYILSGGYSFRFKPESEEDAATVPWMVWPRWTELAQYPDEILGHDPFFQSIASSVAIGLDMGGEQMCRYTDLLPQTFAQPTFLLFLRAVRTVRIDGLPIPLHLRRLDQPNHLVELWNNQNKLTYRRQDFVIDVPADEREAAQLDNQMPGSLQRAQRVKLTLAVPLSDCGPQAVAAIDSILYCFLPTTDNGFAFPALVNGDFLTDPSREKVLPEKRWNNFLFKSLGLIWPRWIASMLADKPEWASAIYNLLPLCYTGKIDLNQTAFNAGLTEAVSATSFILTINKRLVKASEAILDRAGFAKVLSELYKLKLTNGLALVDPAAGSSLTIAQISLLSLAEITLADVIEELSQEFPVQGYTTAVAANLLVYLHKHAAESTAAAFKAVNWLFDQHGKPLQHNEIGRFGAVDEQPDADMPFVSTLRYLHEDLQKVLLADKELREWFEREYPLLPPLTRASSISLLGSKLGASQVTQAESVAVTNYLFKLYTTKELAKVGDATVLGKLQVRTKAGGWLAVNQVYLPDFYQPNYPLETLAAELGHDKFPFVADDYCQLSDAADWGIFWSKLGVGRPEAVELLTTKLLPLLTTNKLAEASHDALARFAIKVYATSKRGELDAHWIKLGALRLRTSGTIRRPLVECVVSDTYPEVPALVGQLLPQGMPTLLAADYADVPQVTPAVVRQFLAHATGHVASPSSSVIVLAIAHLVGAGAPTTATESVRVVQQLAGLVTLGQLAVGLKPLLTKLPLFLKNETKQIAGLCYLATEYGPKLDIEKLSGGTQKGVLGAGYLDGITGFDNIRLFLTDWLGVKERFEPEWHPKISLTQVTAIPKMLPYWQYVKGLNPTLSTQSVDFHNLLVVNNLELITNLSIAEHFANALASVWPNKPSVFPLASYQFTGKANTPLSPLLGKSLIYVRSIVGKSPQAGQRLLSNTLLKTAPKSAWVVLHDFGSRELEGYFGIQKELNLNEQLEAFDEQVVQLQQGPLTESEFNQFEKLAAPLLAFFKKSVNDATLPAWRLKLKWPAADGCWHTLADLHWLGVGAVKYYGLNRAQWVLRLTGQIEEQKNFCLALKVSVITGNDFQAMPPPDGGRDQTSILQQRSEKNQVLRILGHRHFGYDSPTIVAKQRQKLASLRFLEVDSVKLVCSRIPGFVVPVEERCQVDNNNRIFYFSGPLFESWRHLGVLGHFISTHLDFDVSPQEVVDLLKARDNLELRNCLTEAGWPVPEWLVESPPISQPNPSLGEVLPVLTAGPSIPVAAIGSGDGGAHALYNPGVSAEKRKDYQKEAQEAAKSWLGRSGYVVEADGRDDYSTFNSVFQPKTYSTWRVVVKSYKGGILYLNPNEWITLAAENSFLLLYKPKQGQAAGDEIEVVPSLTDVHKRNPNIIVRFHNTDEAGSLENLTKLAEDHQFSSSFKFIFDSPSNELFDFELAVTSKVTGPLSVDDPDTDIS